MIKRTIRNLLLVCSLLFFVLLFGASTFKTNSKKEYAVALSEYTIEDFNENIIVVSPSLKTINTNGKFILLELGVYKIYNGSLLTKEISVLYQPLDVSFNMEEDIVSVVSTNTPVLIPKAVIYSSFERFDSYSVSIKRDNEEITFEKVSKDFYYTFNQSGNYSIVYSVVDSFGFNVEKCFDLKVTQKAEIINIDYPENWSVLSTIDFSNVQGLFEGESYNVDISLKNPNNEQVDIVNNQYTFTEPGEYKATFNCNFGETSITETLSLFVKLSEASYFSNGKNIVSITPSKDTTHNKGLEIKADGAGSTVYYNKLINLDEYTKNDNIIEFNVPYDDESDVHDLRVTLIDANNKDNYFSVYWRRSRSVGWEHITYCLIEFNGYSTAICNETGKPELGKLREIYGAILTCSFTRETDSPFGFTYSQEENAVYTYRKDAKGNYLIKLIDFDDLELLGKYAPWYGFSSSDVYLKIDFLENVKSKIIISKIDNKNLTREDLIVEDVNYLRFNYKDSLYLKDEDIEILAYKNHTCKLPEPITSNEIFGDFDVNLKVYYKDGGSYKLVTNEITDYTFVPTYGGDYKAVYSYIDMYGIPKEKVFEFVVNNGTAPQIKIHLLNKTENELNIYQDILSTCVIPQIVLEGGTGKIKSTITYSLNGTTPVFPNEYGEIYLDTKGYIEIKVKAVDDIDVEKEVIFKIIINSDIQIIKLEEEPKTVMAGRETILADFNAWDYCFNEGESGFLMDKCIYVDGELVNGNTFICPTDKDYITITYYGAKGTSKEVKKEVIVKVIKCDSDNYTNLENLFEGVNKSISNVLFEDGYKIDFNKNLDIHYVNPLVAREFNFSFSLIEDRCNFETINLRLSDYQNESESLTVSFANLTLSSVDMLINGEKVASLSGRQGTYEYGTLKNINYSNYAINLIDYLQVFTLNSNVVLSKITEYENGKSYKGFSSGLLFLDISTTGTNYSSTLIIKTISNQNFTEYAIYDGQDEQSPVIGILKEFNKQYSYRENIEIPKAISSDVLQGKVYAIDLVVITPNGRTYNFDATKQNNIVFDEYGTYSFIYTARDYFGNQTEFSKFITIVDKEKPIIVVNDNLPDELKSGTSLNIGNVTISDNIGVEVQKIFVYTPESELIEVNGNFTFNVTGNYKIIYYASDATGNFTNAIYNIKVK